MTSQAVERMRIRMGGYSQLKGKYVKANTAFSEIMVWLYVDLHTVKAWWAIATEMCFRILILGKWKLDYMFIHMYEIVLSSIYMYTEVLRAKLPSWLKCL